MFQGENIGTFPFLNMNITDENKEAFLNELIVFS